ncbi:MAG: glyoxalase/bleomycin resistance/extradiol dioxygenase family protein [Balneolaceae bacterium]|nr:MAG: glyoxalase/bleomycin resistance/extradiol dioxygenase family protein [Balneolaceae bacterium]
MKISGILETCMYAKDLNAAREFYMRLPGVELAGEEPERHLFFRVGNAMLLIFNPAHTSSEQTEVNGDIIPLHGAEGAGHIAFSVKNKEISNWKEFFAEQETPIESEVTWPNGAVSIYFRDPAGNSLEIVSPKFWNF